MSVAYLDASALVKLAVREPESAALDAAVAGDEVRVASLVGRVELERAVRRAAPADPGLLVERVLGGVTILPFNVPIAAVAARLAPTSLRSLDAIHLATAVAIADELDHVYCYDRRLAGAFAERGLRVLAPR